MVQRLSLVLLAATILLASRSVIADVDRWTPVGHGLPGLARSPVFMDAGNPAILYTWSGYRSTNRGGDWTSVGLFQGFPPRPTLTSPTRTGTVYAAFDGLLRSVDFGDTWVKLYSLPLFTHQYLQGIIEAANGDRLVLVDGYTPFTPSAYDIPDSHVLRSDDSGETWVDASAGLPHAFLDAVAIDPGDAATMYASVGNGVYKTVDGGNSWAYAGSVSDPVRIVDIEVQPRRPNTVYAATLPDFGVYDNPGGLYVSVDGGATRALNQSLGHVGLNSLTFDTYVPSTIYAASNGQGVFRSTNAGQTWIAMSDGLNSADALRVQNLAVDPVDSRNLYVGTDAGVFALTLVDPSRVAAVIEYYAPQFDDYFITPVIDEIHALDTQVIPGWYRTGYSFEAYIQPTAGADPICRFYIPPASHFFSGFRPECAAVLKFDVPPFVYESPNSFYLPAPDMTTGACPAGLLPVYRLYNNNPILTNHRYTSDITIKAQMVAKGYIAEGYGPNRVMMCAPQ